MIIAFWSPVPGQSGTTSNMLAAAVMSAMILKKRTFLLQSHLSDRGLEKALLGKEADGEMFENIGLDSLSRNIKVSELNEEVIHASSLSLYNNRLHLLPGTAKENKNLFEEDMTAALPAILKSVNKVYELLFIDTVPGPDKISKKIKEEADLIVVTFPQNKNIIDNYFSRYHHPEQKTVYLIGNYNRNSRYNRINLERSYHSLKNKTAVIPYNAEYMDAMTDGRTIPYIVKNMVNCKGESNQYFIKKIKKAVDLISGRFIKGGDNV